MYLFQMHLLESYFHPDRVQPGNSTVKLKCSQIIFSVEVVRRVKFYQLFYITRAIKFY